MQSPSQGRNTRPLPETSTPATRRSWVDRLTTRKALALILGLSTTLLVLAALGAWYLVGLRQKHNLQPDLSITPPGSLSELATQYPELAPILEDAALDSAYKDFLLAYQQGGPEAALQLARQRGLVNDKDQLRITLELDTEDHTALVAQLEAQGILVTAASGNLIDLAVPLQLIDQLAQSGDLSQFFAGLSELEHVKKIRLPRTNIQGLGNWRLWNHFFVPHNRLQANAGYPKEFSLMSAAFRIPYSQAQAWYSPPLSGDVEIESLERLNIPAWHAAGFTGKGIKIGVLDMGFNTYRSFLGSELPATVTARSFIAGTEIDATDTEHGAACAEIIHDIAPEAELFFAAYQTDVEQFQAIDWLVSQGVNIISHSAGSIIGPMDGSGPIAAKVDSVVATGILWVNSAGNMAQAHYRGTFTDTDGDGFHEFRPGDELLGFIPDGRVAVALNWDAWVTGDQDYDLYILDSNQDIVASSKNLQAGAGDEAAEFISYFFSDNGPYYLAFYARRSTRPAVFDLYMYNTAAMEYTNADYSITTPADSKSALTVGATFWSNDALEDYSSQGPSHDERIKPDISAPAGVSSAVYGEEFYGTSASTPHVAAAAALVWQANPDFSLQQVSQYLKDNAIDLGAPDADSQFGFGRLYLADPVGASAPPPPTQEQPPETEQPVAETPTPKPTKTRRPLEPSPTPVSEQPEESEPEYDLVISKQDLLLISLGLVGCVGLPGLIGIGGIVLVVVALSKSRARRMPQQPVYTPHPPVPQPQPGRTPQPYAPDQVASPWPQPAAHAGYPPTVVAAEPASPAAGITGGAESSECCSRCGSTYRPGARFCNVCGNILPGAATDEKAVAATIYCTRCGMALRPSSKFCPRCGKSR